MTVLSTIFIIFAMFIISTISIISPQRVGVAHGRDARGCPCVRGGAGAPGQVPPRLLLPLRVLGRGSGPGDASSQVLSFRHFHT